MELLELEKKSALQERIVDQYERRYNDTTTLAAEMLDGSMQTSFEYTFDGQELYAQDGSAIGEIFIKAEQDAHVIAARDPRLSCEIRRRGEDCELGEYIDMIAMAKGLGPNTMVTVSDTPIELDSWGEDVGGYNFTRRQTMLRVVSRLPNGKIKVTSQTLDKSDRTSLEAIYGFFGARPAPGELLGQRIKANVAEERQELLADDLTRVYDKKLEEEFGGKYYAGRSPADIDNTYNFVCAQEDLISAFMQNTSDQNLVGLIAALENRWNGRKLLVHEGRNEVTSIPINMSPQAEMAYMATVAGEQGKTYSGCGVTISANGELGALGYGNKQEWYGRTKPVKGTCVNCKEDTMVGEQSWCKSCISGHCGTK